MSRPPPTIGRIRLADIFIAVPMLQSLGHFDVAAVLESETRCFGDALTNQRGSGTLGGMLRAESAPSPEGLIRALVAAGDVLRLLGCSEEVGAFCVSLAALLGALLGSCDPVVTGRLVCIEPTADGAVELILVPYDPIDPIELAPIYDQEVQ
jgi:hypothetical protein